MIERITATTEVKGGAPNEGAVKTPINGMQGESDRSEAG